MVIFEAQNGQVFCGFNYTLYFSAHLKGFIFNEKLAMPNLGLNHNKDTYHSIVLHA